MLIVVELELERIWVFKILELFCFILSWIVRFDNIEVIIDVWLIFILILLYYKMEKVIYDLFRLWNI